MAEHTLVCNRPKASLIIRVVDGTGPSTEVPRPRLDSKDDGDIHYALIPSPKKSCTMRAFAHLYDYILHQHGPHKYLRRRHRAMASNPGSITQTHSMCYQGFIILFSTVLPKTVGQVGYVRTVWQPKVAVHLAPHQHQRIAQAVPGGPQTEPEHLHSLLEWRVHGTSVKQKKTADAAIVDLPAPGLNGPPADEALGKLQAAMVSLDMVNTARHSYKPQGRNEYAGIMQDLRELHGGSATALW